MGQAVVGGGETSAEGDDEDKALASAPAAAVTYEVSLAGLNAQMDAAFDDFSLLRRLVAAPEWAAILGALDAATFAHLVGSVNIGFDQPSVAALLANHLHTQVRCEYVVAALRKCDPSARPGIVQKVSPLCADLGENTGSIVSELTEWERVVTFFGEQQLQEDKEQKIGCQ